jgi:RNA polymerase-binding transcription factor DksA
MRGRRASDKERRHATLRKNLEALRSRTVADFFKMKANIPQSVDAGEELTPDSHIEVRVTGMRAEQLQQIDGALERLQANTYGKCACGADIEEKRLLVMPFAVRCLKCQQTLETSPGHLTRPFGREHVAVLS